MDEIFSMKLNRNYNWEMEAYHFHHCCEVLFIASGECECLVETELTQLRRGTVLPLYATTLHKTNQSSGGEYARYVLHFSAGDIAPFSTPDTDLLKCFSGGPFQLDGYAAKKMAEAFEKCRGLNGGYGQDIRRRNSFFELLVKLGEISGTNLAPRQIINKNYSRIRPILTYIRENPAEQLTLSLLAEKFHFSKQHLCRVFKKITGIGVGDYITSVRIQCACILLRQGKSVQQSGEGAGFVNNSAFITTFGRFVGIPPGKYKKRFAGSMLVDEAHKSQ